MIKSNLNKNLKINQTNLLEKAFKKHSHVLYLVDNAGEIVFDKILLDFFEETLQLFALTSQMLLYVVYIQIQIHFQRKILEQY